MSDTNNSFYTRRIMQRINEAQDKQGELSWPPQREGIESLADMQEERRFLALDPIIQQTLTNLQGYGYNAAINGDYASSFDYFEQYVQHEDSRPDVYAYQWLIKTASRSEQYKPAKKYIKIALSKFNCTPEMYVLAGFTYHTDLHTKDIIGFDSAHYFYTEAIKRGELQNNNAVVLAATHSMDKLKNLALDLDEPWHIYKNKEQLRTARKVLTNRRKRFFLFTNEVLAQHKLSSRDVSWHINDPQIGAETLYSTNGGDTV